MKLETNTAGIPIRTLGSTGTKVSIVGFGGGHYCRKHIDENTSENEENVGNLENNKENIHFKVDGLVLSLTRQL